MVWHQCTSSECICVKKGKIVQGKEHTTPCTKLKETLVETSDSGISGYIPKIIRQTFHVIRNSVVNRIQCYKGLAVTALYTLVSMAYSNPINGYFKHNLPPDGNISQQESMKHEGFRISSYAKFPANSPISVLYLSKAGFFSTGSGDEIQCFSCQFKLKDWLLKADPFNLHKTNSPNCPFLLSTIGNTPINNIGSNHSQNGMDIGPDVNILSDRFGRMTTTTEQADAVSEGPFVSSHHIIAPTETNLNNHNIMAPTETKHNEPPQPNFFSAPPMSDARANSSLPAVETAGDYRYEETRLASYQNWPSDAAVRPKELAESGFYYTGTTDRVQCFFCRGILRSWEPGDRADLEHRRHFGQCPFLMNPQGVGNTPIDNSSGTAPELLPGIVTEAPVHRKYAMPSERLATFADFPSNMTQTPELFTRAGFFYTGISDNVKCFFCDGGLRNWEPNDDPWTEHARLFPRCGYLRLCKGEDFIQQVQDKYASPSKRRNARKRYPKRKDVPINQSDLVKFMKQPMVQSVIDTMGYDPNKVQQVVTYRMQELGNDFFPNAESLLEAVAEYEEELEFKRVHGEEEEETTAPKTQDTAKQHTVVKSQETALTKPPEYMTEDDVTQLKEEVQQMQDQIRCKVCLYEEAVIVFLRCGHMVCCANCAPAMRQCPICREPIRGTTRVLHW